MFEIVKEVDNIIIEKKSKFITRLRKVNSEQQAKDIIKNIKDIEKGATHNCYVYRILCNNSIIERKNDDGEPSGTAASPMLSILSYENIINILAVTTRYFGGIKLGTGGLVSVYKKGIIEALKLTNKVEYQQISNYKIIFPVNETDKINYFLNKEKIKIINKEFNENVIYIVELNKNSLDTINKFILINNFKLIKI